MAETTTDRETIRNWAESHGGKPAAVDRTHQGGDVGIIRIMFPNAEQSEHKSLVEISWDEFFKEFEERQLALLYEPDGLFSKIVSRQTVERREHGEHHAARHDSSAQRDDQHKGGSEARRGGSHQTGSQAQDRQQGGERQGSGSEQSSLKEREYRDAQGNLHHHTKTYMEQHGKK